jgi:hypothetical protein
MWKTLAAGAVISGVIAVGGMAGYDTAPAAMAADAAIEHPSFVQAAMMSLTGADSENFPSNSTQITVSSSYLGEEGTFTLDKNNPCVITAKAVSTVFIIPEFAELSTDYDYMAQAPPQWPVKRFQFNKLPSPATVVHLPDGLRDWAAFPLNASDKAVCNPDGECGVILKFRDVAHEFRRLRALQYIRANYCPGLPEPPQKPY